MKTWLKIIIAIIICEAAGLIGAIFTTPNIASWYATLDKPVFSPPNWLFGPVWTTLYFLMGIAVALIWQKGLKEQKVKKSFIFFWVHLFFNAIWSIIFFGWHQIFWAFCDIIIIWLMILILLIMFGRLKKSAAYLLIPFFIWVSLASVLNFALWWLNR
jgi:tryptophan-rich sensory protein